MLDKFLSYIHEEKLIKKGESILLAVSGGLDSMVMLDLFIKSKIKIGVAHINHHLRAEESDDDAAFVNLFCAELNIPFFQLDLDPGAFEKGNMHDTARQLRYEWLNALATEKKYDKIATAHHKDDEAESFLTNLMRGSGLDGLDGIDALKGIIMRPLLFAEKQDLVHYAVETNLPYREDSSNNTDKYLRNKLRHHILPEMYKMDVRAKNGLQKSIFNIRQSKSLIDYFLQKWSEDNIVKQTDHIQIPLTAVLDSTIGSSFLFHLIKKFGFTMSQCEDMLININGSGRVFVSDGYESVLENSCLLIRQKTKKFLEKPMQIQDLPCTIVYEHLRLEMEVTDQFTNLTYLKNELYFDVDKITFPITIRKRKEGDTIKPLGMNGKSQKLKDYLINKKISKFDKDKIVLLEDKNFIFGVLMEGISEMVKITEQTKKVIRVRSVQFT